MEDLYEFAYKNLRAEFMARHFALTRYARADMFDSELFLGERRSEVPADEVGNASPGGITWRKPPTYQNAQDLRDQLHNDPIRAGELWRWAKHDRTNALYLTGTHMICLAVEAMLGNVDSYVALERVIMQTLKSLFKFDDGSASGYCGFVVRWDAVASDLWETNKDANCPVRLKQNYEFLLEAGLKRFTAGHHYLYCTPLNDPRYQQAKKLYGSSPRGRDRYRRWEASMDEYVGLISGYYVANLMLGQMGGGGPAALQAEIRRQADMVGQYLKFTGYYLVRPCGGFAMRGATDINPLLEYPLAWTLANITQNPIGRYLADRSATFENALNLAGYEAEYQNFHPRPDEMGLQLQSDLRTALAGFSFWPKNALGDAVRDMLLNTGIVSLSPLFVYNLGKAVLFAERLDISGSAETDPAAAAAFHEMIALNYAVNFLIRNNPANLADPAAGAKALFPLWMQIPASGPAEGFKVWLCLSSLEDRNSLIADNYRTWFDRCVAGDTDRSTKEMLKEIPPGHEVAAQAVRALLWADDRDLENQEKQLFLQLENMLKVLNREFFGHPALVDTGDKDNAPSGASHDTVSERYDTRSNYWGFSLPLSLTWLLLNRLNVPNLMDIYLPLNAKDWPRPAVPGFVVEAAQTREIILPVDSAIQNGPLTPGLPEYPLFADPPQRSREADLACPPEPCVIYEGQLVPQNEFRQWLIGFGPKDYIFSYPLTPRPAGYAENEMTAIIVDYGYVRSERVQSFTAQINGNFFEFHVRFNSLRPTRRFQAIFQGRVSISWVYTPAPS